MNDQTSVAKQTQSQSLTPFFVIWTGQAFSLVGSSLVQFTLIWWLTKASGSATVLAFASMMEVLPRVFIGPFAGALVDRWNRRIVMIVADGLIALAIIVLAILYALGVVQVWHIYVIMFLRATGGVFHWPAMQASTPLMVPEKHLTRVAGMNQTLQGVTNILVPPLAALLYETIPIYNILAIDVVTAFLAIVPLFFIAIPQPMRISTSPGTESRPSIWTDLREGLRFVGDWPGLIIILAAAAIANLMGNPAFSLVPLLVSKHFGGGALELGWLQSAFGIGIILGGLTLSIWGGFKRRMVTVCTASILGGIGFVVIGITPANAILLAVGMAFLIGFTNPILNGSLMAMLQAIIPPQMLGRIFTLILSITGVTTPLGLAIAGPVADTLGLPVWFLVSGIVTVVMGTIQLFVPVVIRIEDRTPTENKPR